MSPASMNEMVLIRHVETDLAGTFCGHSDPDLNAAGERRLRTLVDEVAPLGITHMYSSDLRRASRTAMAIGERVGAPVELRPGLREIHFGKWEGLRWEEIEQRYPDESRMWLSEFPARSAPGGESYADFTARIDAEFKARIGNGIFEKSKTVKLAIVSHRGVMEYALTRFFTFSGNEARKATKNYGAIVVAAPSIPREVEYTGIRA